MGVATAWTANELAVVQPKPRHVFTTGTCDIERLSGRQLARAATENFTGTLQQNAQEITPPV
jgi:hypothetical protein